MARYHISSLQQLYKQCFRSTAACPPPSFSIACQTTSWPFQERASSSSGSKNSSNVGTGHNAAAHDGCGAECGTHRLAARAVRSLGCNDTAALAHVARNTTQHPASPSSASAFWWLQGGRSSQQQQLPATSVPDNHLEQASWSQRSLQPPNPLFQASLAPLSIHRSSQLEGLPLQHQQLRGYKSNKKSMKPVYAKANRLAVQPLLPPISPEEREQRLRYKRAPIIDTALPPIPTPPRPVALRRVGYITRGYHLDLQPKFAVVEVAGTQFKVTVDDVIFINSLSGQARVNEVLSLGRVMLLGSTETTLIGRPYVPGAFVEAAVEEHFLDGKVHVLKFKRRNRYRKYAAPRPHLTTLRILSIHGLPEASTTAPGVRTSEALLDQEKGALQQPEQGREQAQAAQQAVVCGPGLPIKYYSEAVVL